LAELIESYHAVTAFGGGFRIYVINTKYDKTATIKSLAPRRVAFCTSSASQKFPDTRQLELRVDEAYSDSRSKLTFQSNVPNFNELPILRIQQGNTVSAPLRAIKEPTEDVAKLHVILSF
jgi:hypothetical protein